MISQLVLVVGLLCAGFTLGKASCLEPGISIKRTSRKIIDNEPGAPDKCNECLRVTFEVIKHAAAAKEEGKNYFLSEPCAEFNHKRQKVCRDVLYYIEESGMLNIMQSREFCALANYCPARPDRPVIKPTDHDYPDYPNDEPNNDSNDNSNESSNENSDYDSSIIWENEGVHCKKPIKPRPIRPRPIKPRPIIPITLRPVKPVTLPYPWNPITPPTPIKPIRPPKPSHNDPDSHNDSDESEDTGVEHKLVFGRCRKCEIIVRKWRHNIHPLSFIQTCMKLPQHVREYCLNLAFEHGPVIKALLREGNQPHEVCEAIRACKSPKKFTYCRACNTYVNGLNHGNWLPWNVVCSYLPSEENKNCAKVLQKNQPEILKLMSNDADPEEVCKVVHLCPKKSKVSPESHHHAATRSFQTTEE